MKGCGVAGQMCGWGCTESLTSHGVDGIKGAQRKRHLKDRPAEHMRRRLSGWRPPGSFRMNHACETSSVDADEGSST